MPVRGSVLAFFYLCCFAPSLLAQIPPVKTDPLHPAQIIQGPGACSVTEPSSCAQAAAKITPIVMGESPLENNLRHLTDDIGGRVTGSPEMTKAVEWGITAFRTAGVDVHTETYSLPHAWSEGATRLEVLGPISFPVSLVSLGLSPATPPEGIEAPLVFIGDGSKADFVRAGASIKGAILLVHTEVSYTWADLFREYDVPPPIIEANRSLLAALVATNVLGQNTPAIAATEALYAEMWAQDATAMYGYAGTSATASQVTPFTAPPQTTNSSGLVSPSVAAAQSAGTSSGTDVETIMSSGPQVISGMPQALQSLASPQALDSVASTATDSSTSSTSATSIMNELSTPLKPASMPMSMLSKLFTAGTPSRRPPDSGPHCGHRVAQNRTSTEQQLIADEHCLIRNE